MKREEFEKFSQFTEEKINELEFADIDIEEKFDRIMNVCFALLNMCDAFVDIMSDEELEGIKLTQE